MADADIPSFNAQILALKRGESLAKAKRFPDLDGVNDELQAMRRTVNAAASRLRGEGSHFRVESGALITSDNGAVLAVVAVTRI